MDEGYEGIWLASLGHGDRIWHLQGAQKNRNDTHLAYVEYKGLDRLDRKNLVSVWDSKTLHIHFTKRTRNVHHALQHFA